MLNKNNSKCALNILLGTVTFKVLRYDILDIISTTSSKVKNFGIYT